MILLHLDVESLLIARKASRIFDQTISSSLKLRRALFLEADDTISTSEVVLNPLAEKLLNDMGHKVSWEVFDPNSKEEQERYQYIVHPPMALLDHYAILKVRIGEGSSMNPRRLVSKCVDEKYAGDMLASQPPVLIDTLVKNERTGFFVSGVKRQKDANMRDFLNSLLWILNC